MSVMPARGVLAAASLLTAGCANLMSSPWAPGQPDARPWRIVSSSNFRIYTDGDVELAKERLEVLERFRIACGVVTTVELADDLPALRLVAPNDLRDYETLQPSRSEVIGYYRRTRHGPVAVFPLRSSRDFGGLHVALHEYVHHLHDRAGGVPVPAWFREGIAEYLAAAKVESTGHVLLGGIPKNRALWLRHGRWTEYSKVMLESETTRPEMFYPQAWLLVHFLINEHHAGMRKYLATYRDHPRAEAFAAAFGFPVSELHRRVLRYSKRKMLPAQRLAPRPLSYKVQVEKMGADERDYLLAHMGVGFKPKERVRAILSTDGPVRLAHLALAEQMLWVERDIARAEALIDQLSTAYPGDPRIVLLEAQLLARPREKGEPVGRYRDRVKAATKLALTVNARDADSIEAFELIARTGLQLGHVSGDNIRVALMNAMNLAPSRNDLLYLYLQYLARFGTRDEAKRVGRVLISRTESRELREATRAVLAELPEP